jgi:hypothetical protein
MKKNLQFMMMFTVFAVFFACASTAFAQFPRVGGFKPVAVNDAAVVAAAKFAVSDHSQKNEVSLKLVQIHKAERQTVQGAVYRMCIEVGLNDEENEETQYVLVQVSQDLKRVYKLTAWKPDGCAPE